MTSRLGCALALVAGQAAGGPLLLLGQHEAGLGTRGAGAPSRPTTGSCGTRPPIGPVPASWKTGGDAYRVRCPGALPGTWWRRSTDNSGCWWRRWPPARPSPPVATCGDWTMADLWHHVGGSRGFWSHALCEGSGRPSCGFPPNWSGWPAPAADRAAWLEGVGRDLVGELAATPPDTETWSWFPRRPLGRFCGPALRPRAGGAPLRRRRADPDDESDPVGLLNGLDELLTVLTTARHPDRPGHRPESLHRRDRSGDHGRVAGDPAARRVTVTRRHAKGDLALRGAAGDLELLVYRRPPWDWSSGWATPRCSTPGRRSTFSSLPVAVQIARPAWRIATASP